MCVFLYFWESSNLYHWLLCCREELTACWAVFFFFFILSFSPFAYIHNLPSRQSTTVRYNFHFQQFIYAPYISSLFASLPRFLNSFFIFTKRSSGLWFASFFLRVPYLSYIHDLKYFQGVVISINIKLSRWWS